MNSFIGTFRHFFAAFFLLMVCFSPVAKAAGSDPVTQIQYLSGTDKDHTVEWEFFCTAGRNSGTWSTIQVPSCWEQQGYGTYNYGRDYRTYGKEHSLANEQGMYRYRFSVPASWKDQEVHIVFEGSMTDTEVKINGVSAGPLHQGAFYRFKYDISDKLKYGAENLLEVTVSKMSANSSVNNAERLADFWIFGGIFRPVFLEALPQKHISRFAVDAKADGSFSAEVYTAGLSKALQVKAEILDASGKVVGTATENAPIAGTSTNGANAAGNAGLSGAVLGEIPVILNTKVSDPPTWTAETPSLTECESASSMEKR
jgi:beta-galactosidase/beta-glucuronidase